MEALTGREASRQGYRLLKLVGGFLSRMIKSNDISFNVDLSKLSSFDFSSALDFLFEHLPENEFLNLVDTFLSRVKYEKGEYLKCMDNEPFNGDFEITLGLLKESITLNYGFFSQILIDSTKNLQVHKTKN